MLTLDKKKALEWFENTPPVRRAYSFAKSIRVSVSHDVSLFLAIKFIAREFRDNHLAAESKAVAYNWTLAIFPLIISLFTMTAYLEDYGFFSQSDLLDFLEDSMPRDIYRATDSTIKDIVGEKRGSLLSFGFVLALFMSTNGMLSLMDAFNRCYRTRENRNFLKRRLIALFLTLLMIFVLVTTMILIVFGGIILEWLGGLLSMNELKDLRVFQYLGYIVIFYGAISFIYYFAPSVQKRWALTSYGTIIAAGLSIGASVLFSYYVTNLATYNEVYGSIGVLIAFMIWVQLMAVIILIGFEINAGIDRAKTYVEKLGE